MDRKLLRTRQKRMFPNLFFLCLYGKTCSSRSFSLHAHYTARSKNVLEIIIVPMNRSCRPFLVVSRTQTSTAAARPAKAIYRFSISWPANVIFYHNIIIRTRYGELRPGEILRPPILRGGRKSLRFALPITRTPVADRWHSFSSRRRATSRLTPRKNQNCSCRWMGGAERTKRETRQKEANQAQKLIKYDDGAYTLGGMYENARVLVYNSYIYFTWRWCGIGVGSGV